MGIDRRITNGLAWAGVLLIVGVPAADLLSAQFMGGADRETVAHIAAIEPVEAPVPAPQEQRPEAPAAQPAPEPTPAAEPVAARPTGQGSNVVDSFLQSGRPLPSYITGSDAPAAAAQPAPSQPAPSQTVAATPPATTPPATTPSAAAAPPAATTPAATPPAATQDPVEVAAIPPKVAPIPMPLSMRPRPVAEPIADVPVVVPPGVAGPIELTAADLEDWESGPLSEFLARRMRQQQGVVSDYDPNGFYLDQGPNSGSFYYGN